MREARVALIVQKFGGTSLSDITRIRHVAQIIIATQKKGHDIVVVVSAMSGETDRLIQLAQSITPDVDSREYDALVSTGEQVSAALLSQCLITQGCPARSYNANQVTILTDNQHKKANILNIDTNVILTDLQQGRVPVITGFQGIDSTGHITTLGRGGSDMSAVAIANALKADECQIYTDVDGIYTTDPRVVKKARRLNHITFDEMLELSNLGAKVLQIRAVELANQYNLPLRVLSSFHDGGGTLVTMERGDATQSVVSGIVFDRNQAKLTLLGVPHQSEFSKIIVQSIKNASIEVDMMIENVYSQKKHVDFSFTVHAEDFYQTLTITKSLARKLGVKDVIGNDSVAKISVVGVGIKSHAGVASKMFHTLGEEGIVVHLITSSEVKISAVIDQKYMERGACALHTAFGLDI